MEALKNTSMMIILAGIFYGAYQMFVSEPPNWRKGSAETELLIQPGDQAADMAQASTLSEGASGSNWWGDPTPMSADSRESAESAGAAVPFRGAAPGPMAPHLNPNVTPNRATLGEDPRMDPRGSAAGPAPRLQTDVLPNSLPGTMPPPMNSDPTLALGAGRLPGLQTPPADNGSGAAGQAAGQGLAAVPMDTFAQGDARSPSIQRDRRDFAIPERDMASGYPVERVGYVETETVSPPSTAAGGFGQPSRLEESRPTLLPIESRSAERPDASLEMTRNLKVAMEAAGADIQRGEWVKPLKELSAWYQQPLRAEDREHLVGWLDRLAGQVVYSRTHTLVQGHRVTSGETLASIASRYQMPPRLLARINQYPDTVAEDTPLDGGVELKVVPGPFEAVADMGRRELTMYAGGMYAGRFPFAIGDSAPEEAITDAISYVSLQGIPAQEDQRRHEPLSPTNPFGRLCLVVGQTAVLHSPGGNPQGSCLQFSEQDMQDLLVLLPRGTTVHILP